MTNKKILVTVSKEMYPQVEEVQKKLGHMSIAETGRYAFQALIKKELNNYVEIQKERLKNKKDNPPKISKKVEAADLQQNFCDALEGKVEESKGGPVCVYTVYQELPGGKIQDTPNTLPLSALTQDIVDYQYETLTGQRGEDARRNLKAILRDNQ